MKYHSTRWDGNSDLLSFEDVLFSPGYARDGGLYVCQDIPIVSTSEQESWKELSYPCIVKKILRLFIGQDEITDKEIDEIVASSFQDFESPDKVIHIEKLDNSLYVAELFQGPTLAFKDLSLAVLGKLLEFFLKKKDKRIKILVGTSGDTGPAAAHSVAHLERVDLVLLYPLNRVSKYQELQMLTVRAPNVIVCSVEGNSDELDQPIKECFQDVSFAADNHLGSLNSLQWGRIFLQASHYIYVYLQCCPRVGDQLRIVVPTGAAGNLAAGFLVHRMGFPIRLVASVNSNDILARSFQHGDYSPSPTVDASLAPAMDIQAPYNIERVLYFATHGDGLVVQKIMQEMEKDGKVRLPPEILSGLREVVEESISVNDAEIVQAMKRCYDQYGYLVCPHTSTALSYYFKFKERVGSIENEIFVCLATASSAKFPDACLAVGLDTPIHYRLEELKSKTEILSPRHVFLRGQDWTRKLKEIILSI